MSRKNIKKFLICSALLLIGCATVPYTGRKQLNAIPRSQELQLGRDAYAQILQKNKLSTAVGPKPLIRLSNERS